MDHPVFPEWLVKREDFKSYFTPGVDGDDSASSSIYMIEHTCSIPPQERKPSDLDPLLRWFRSHRVLQSVKKTRLTECYRNIQLLSVPPGTNIVTQGDPGDAFYVIVQGTCSVLVKEQKLKWQRAWCCPNL